MTVFTESGPNTHSGAPGDAGYFGGHEFRGEVFDSMDEDPYSFDDDVYEIEDDDMLDIAAENGTGPDRNEVGEDWVWEEDDPNVEEVFDASGSQHTNEEPLRADEIINPVHHHGEGSYRPYVPPNERPDIIDLDDNAHWQREEHHPTNDDIMEDAESTDPSGRDRGEEFVFGESGFEDLGDDVEDGPEVADDGDDGSDGPETDTEGEEEEPEEPSAEVIDHVGLNERIGAMHDAREEWIRQSVNGNGKVITSGRKYKEALANYENEYQQLLSYAAHHKEELLDELGIDLPNLDSDDKDAKDTDRRKLAVLMKAEEVAQGQLGRADYLEERGNTKRAKVMNWYQDLGKKKKIVGGLVVGGAISVLAPGVVGVALTGAAAAGLRAAKGFSNNYKGYTETAAKYQTGPDSMSLTDSQFDEILRQADEDYQEGIDGDGNVDHESFIKARHTGEVDASLEQTRKGNRKAVGWAMGTIILGETIGHTVQNGSLPGFGNGRWAGMRESFLKGDTELGNRLDNGIRGLMGREGAHSPAVWSRTDAIAQTNLRNDVVELTSAIHEVDPADIGGSGEDVPTFGNGEFTPPEVETYPSEASVDVSTATDYESGGGYQEAAEVSGTIERERVFESFTGVVEKNQGATHLMDQMFSGQYEPKELHNIYLAALEEKGSDSLAGLFNNAEALDEATDRWGTQTYFNPGDNGISADGVEYFHDLADRLANDSDSEFHVAHTAEINPDLVSEVEVSPALAPEEAASSREHPAGSSPSPEATPEPSPEQTTDTVEQTPETPEAEPVNDDTGVEEEVAEVESQPETVETSAERYVPVEDLDARISSIDYSQNPTFLANHLTDGGGAEYLIQDAIDNFNSFSPNQIIYRGGTNFFDQGAPITYVEGGEALSATDNKDLNQEIVQIIRQLNS